MRLASAFMFSVLLGASGALAAPASSAQDPATPHAGANASSSSAAAPRDRWREGVGPPQASAESSPRLSRMGARTFSTGGGGARDQITEATCYNVFGQLRCDRVPAKAR